MDASESAAAAKFAQWLAANTERLATEFAEVKAVNPWAEWLTWALVKWRATTRTGL